MAAARPILVITGQLRQRYIDDDLRREPLPESWSTLDNSDEPVEQTVERVLSIAR